MIDIDNQTFTKSSGLLTTSQSDSVVPENTPITPTQQGDFFPAVWAAIKRYNPELSITRRAVLGASMDQEADPTFNPFNNLDEKYYPFHSLVDNARTSGDLAHIKAYADRAIEEKTLANSNIAANLIGTLIGGGFSPSTFSTGLAAGAVLGVTSKTALGAFAKSAAIGAVADVPFEAALMASDPTFHLDEAWTGVVMSALTGGAFEATVHGLKSAAKPAKGLVHELVRPLEDMLEESGNTFTRLTKSSKLSPEDYLKEVEQAGITASNPLFNFFTSGGGRNFQPSVAARLLTSPSLAVREITNKLVEHNFTIGKNKSGLANDISIESIIDANVFKNTRVIDDAILNGHLEHKAKGGTLKLAAFETEVARAARRGGQSNVPGVGATAKVYRTLMDDYLEQYKSVDVFKDMEAPKDGESYFTRIYDREAIDLNPEGWRTLLSRHIGPGDNSDAIVTEITNKIMGNHYIDLENLAWTDANAKARTLHIPDIELEPFLRNDVRGIAKTYILRAEKDINLHKVFGTTNKEKILEQVIGDYNSMPEKGLTSDPKRMTADLEDLNTVFDRLVGTRGAPKDPMSIGSQFIKGLLPFNMIRMLGGVGLTQLPELVRSQLLKFTEKVALRNVRDLDDSISKIGLSQAERQSLGIYLDHAQRIMLLAQGSNMTAAARRESAVVSGLHNAGEVFAQISMMGPIDNFVRASLATTSANSIYKLTKAIAAGDKLDESLLLPLRKLGIDDKMATKISAYADKYGENVDGVFYLNAHQWPGKTGDTMRTALRKYVNAYLINPGAADRFGFADVNPAAKVLMQFRSYSQGSWSRTFLPGLQDSEYKLLGYIGTLVGVGYLLTYLKDSAKGYGTKEKDTKTRMTEALSNSGAVPYLFDLYSTVDNTFFGGGTSRQQIQGKWDTILGPSAGLVTYNTPALLRTVSGQPQPGDVRALKQLVPFNNVIWWNYYLNKKSQELATEIKANNQ